MLQNKLEKKTTYDAEQVEEKQNKFDERATAAETHFCWFSLLFLHVKQSNAIMLH